MSLFPLKSTHVKYWTIFMLHLYVRLNSKFIGVTHTVVTHDFVLIRTNKILISQHVMTHASVSFIWFIVAIFHSEIKRTQSVFTGQRLFKSPFQNQRWLVFPQYKSVPEQSRFRCEILFFYLIYFCSSLSPLPFLYYVSFFLSLVCCWIFKINSFANHSGRTTGFRSRSRDSLRNFSHSLGHSRSP